MIEFGIGVILGGGAALIWREPILALLAKIKLPTLPR